RGEEQELIDRFKNNYVFNNANSLSGHYSDNDIGKEYYWAERIFTVYIDKEPHTVYLIYMVNYRTDTFIRYYLSRIALFSLLVLGITALYCWRKNIINKTKYAMEDYQRDLTNHLAHDIKTPLMAIGGYTENIMEGQLSDEEQKEYLSAILKNIEFTDSIINRTLLLNRLDNTSEMKSEKISVEKTVSDAISKYKPMFEEKNIRITTEGSAEVKADRTSFEKIVENLVSNAVKYTPENGTVKITADKKQLIVSNTVKEKIDTKELKTPFVRGDKSRSNTDGCGLGLSIAERAAAVNGFKLNVSCTDAEFKTVIKF
ncbi:MAG: HAMP domain-containing histidine kinase, partial [Ruminococcus sp.]|nr:HAMP domain-containing histidine kinase [Ruminococcus sp.]